MVRIRSPQDLGAAVTFFVIGLTGFWFGWEYDTGTVSAMGPGYLPLVLSYALMFFGLVIGVRALTFEGPPVATIRWRSVVLILLSILTFALLIRRAGLAVTVVAVAAVAALASAESKWRETIALALFLAVFSVLVFVYGLGQAISVFWGD